MVDLNGKTILVTGGCGFIGSNFIEFILKQYEKLSVFNIDKMGVGSRDVYPLVNGYHNLYFYKVLDIRNIQSWNALDNLDIDYIFHFAAESHVDRSISDPMSFINNNINGMVSLLEWVKKYHPNTKVINISTDEVYGHLNINDYPFTEESNLNPRSPYSASKASSDLIANSYCNTFGLNIVTTRCCNNYGPYQHDEKFIPVVIKNIINDTEIPVYGTGKNIREWIYVEDHNKSILEIADIGESGQVYNIGSKIEMTNLELINMIGKLMLTTPKIKFVEDRKGHDFRYAITSNHYKRAFKLKNHYEAMASTVKFYCEKYVQSGK